MAKQIAIPSHGDQLDAHFGRAQAFTVFEIVGNEAHSVGTLSAQGLQHQHEGLADMFKRNGIEVLICGGIGEGMIVSLNQAGLDLITGASGQVNEVAQLYAKGTLISSNTSCQEHGHEHGLHH
ncbi:diguanylate cyclase [Alicyclobacillaceae bacterium I2511]|jgi:predicted Fe-Mo cluster-binding NifX family protein|nr:diguanylate cyclase [Alicyclobacillaceae bacterium I2511]